METQIKTPRNIDELITMMKERKKNRKIENEKKFNSPEFQITLKKLNALNKIKNV